MSDAWACHYRKNTPGYRDPWDLCEAEREQMLACAEAMYNKQIFIGYTGYTSGVPSESWEVDKSGPYYAGSSVIFEVQLFTGFGALVMGEYTDYKICTGYVEATFYQLHPTTDPTEGNPELRKKLLTTGFRTDDEGYYSGIFPTFFLEEQDAQEGPPRLSGFFLASRYYEEEGQAGGLLTGTHEFVDPLARYPTPTLDGQIRGNSEVGDCLQYQACLNVTNNGELPGIAYIHISTDFGNSSEVLLESTEEIAALSAWFPNNIQLNSSANKFYFFQASFVPRGFDRGVPSVEIIKGGTLPAPTNARLRWRYLNPTDTINSSPYLHIDIDYNILDYFTNVVVYYRPYDEGTQTYGSWIELGPASRVDEDQGDEDATNDVHYFLMPLDSLVNTKFKVKVHVVSPGEFISLPYPSEDGLEIALNTITLSVTKATTTCGAYLKWDGPSWPAASYKIIITAPGEDAVTLYDIYEHSYFHNPTCSETKTYTYQVCFMDDENLTACSNSVAVSLSPVLEVPRFSLVPIRAPDELSDDVPTTKFDMRLSYENETREGISFVGERIRVVNDTRIAETITIPKDVGTNCLDKQLIAGEPPFALEDSVRAEAQRIISYNLAHQYQSSTSDYYARSVAVPRKPPTPILSMSIGGQVLQFSWRVHAQDAYNTINQYEKFRIYQQINGGNPTLIYNGVDFAFAYDTQGFAHGTYTFFMKTTSEDFSLKGFSSVSSNSNSVQQVL